MTERMNTEALQALVNNAQGGVFTYEANANYDELRTNGETVGHIIRFKPHDRSNTDGTTTISCSFPVVAATAWLADPEEALTCIAEFANAAPALAAEVLELRAEVEQLRATIGACRWLWPADDTSSEMCADHPRELAETIDAQEGEVFGYSRGGVVETRYFAYLRADDQSDSDDDFEVDEATEEAASAKILAEVARRTAQRDRA